MATWIAGGVRRPPFKSVPAAYRLLNQVHAGSECQINGGRTSAAGRPGAWARAEASLAGRGTRGVGCKGRAAAGAGGRRGAGVLGAGGGRQHLRRRGRGRATGAAASLRSRKLSGFVAIAWLARPSAGNLREGSADIERKPREQSFVRTSKSECTGRLVRWTCSSPLEEEEVCTLTLELSLPGHRTDTVR